MSTPDPGTVTLTANPQTGDVTASDASGYPLGKPSNRTVSLVWVGIVFANVAVMVIAAIGLVVGQFLPARASLVEPALLLTLFTTPAAFLAGLIARDPGRHS
jgi:hypothetical protein